MLHPPADVGAGLLRAGLAAFGPDADGTADPTYLPLGFGDHHWTAAGPDGRTWFLTVADLDAKPDLGPDRVTALHGLRRAMDTAAALGERLEAVVAPRRTGDGRTVVALDDRYALSVFRWLPGRAGGFGERWDDDGRARVLDVLAALHAVPPPEGAPVAALAPPHRDRIEAVLAGAPAPATAGPFTAPAHELAAARAPVLRARLAEFDELARRVRARGAPVVVTHGEPHPANVLRDGDVLRLLDWDTVGLAGPERDLSVVSADPAVLARWSGRTGREPDPDALALWPLRWSLAEIGGYLDLFAHPHGRTPDTGYAQRELEELLDELDR